MRTLSEATAKIASLSFERKYIALGRIVKHWHDIVGPSLADKAQPVKLHYRKKTEKTSTHVTLEIAASSADATLLHYQKDLILERINQIFGERWITAIKFIQIAANTQPQLRKKARPPLTASEKKTLSELLISIEDYDMKQRLENLGQAILMDQK